VDVNLNVWARAQPSSVVLRTNPVFQLSLTLRVGKMKRCGSSSIFACLAHSLPGRDVDDVERQCAAEKGCMLYMGKDKFENEELIKHAWPEDVWFHVDRESSAHVYIRLPRCQTLNPESDFHGESSAHVDTFTSAFLCAAPRPLPASTPALPNQSNAMGSTPSPSTRQPPPAQGVVGE